MNLLFLDFETYYDKDLTLTKLNYTEYIRSTEVQLAGVLYQSQLQTLEDPTDFFNTLDWPNITLVGHNLLFDAAVLNHFYGHQAGRYIDTLGMARALYPCSKHGLGDLAKQFDSPIHKGNLNTKGQREPDLAALSPYCAKDVLITHFLYHKLKPEFDRYLGSDELDLMDHTIKLWLNPIIQLNHTRLADIVHEEAEEKQRLLDEAGMTIEQMRSNAQFAQHLESMGYEPPTKWSVKQNKLVYAFAKADIQAYAEENPELEPLLSLKSQCNSNIKESRALRLANSITHEKQVPIAYNYHGAFTGRFCLTGDTQIYVLREGEILITILLELLPTDLVWDGEAFVPHDGLLDQGEHEVITYDSITGTPDHRVYVEEIDSPVELGEAAERNYSLKTANPPPGFTTHAASTIRNNS